jgi:hypothetical protein
MREKPVRHDGVGGASRLRRRQRLAWPYRDRPGSLPQPADGAALPGCMCFMQSLALIFIMSQLQLAICA